jgi:proline racemase
VDADEGRGEGGTGRTLRARNAVVMSNGALDWERPSTWTGMIDRSPCGTGTCAVMASLWSRGEMKIGDTFLHESIVGTTFIGRLEAETTVAAKEGGAEIPAVVPSIEGSAWITQHCDVVVDPTDPFPAGYTVGDIWSS